MSICTQCGAALMDGAKFCTKCGTPAAAPIPQTTPAEPPVSESAITEPQVTEAPTTETAITEPQTPEVPSADSPTAETPVMNNPAPQAVITPELQKPQQTAFEQAYQPKPQKDQMTAFEQAYQPKQPQPAGPYQQNTQQFQQNTSYQQNTQQFQQNYQGQPYAAAPAKKPMNKGVLAAIIAGAAVLVLIIAIVICVNVFGGKAYEKPVEKLEKGMNSHDIETLMEAFPAIPGLDTDTMKYMFDFDDEMSGISNVSIDVISAVPLSADELSSYNNYNMFTYMTDYPFQITEGYTLYVKITTTYNGGYDSGDGTITVGKINGKWAIIDLD